MLLFSCISYNDWILILLNVAFFVIVQTLFFKYIASKQYDQVLIDKSNMIKLYLDEDSTSMYTQGVKEGIALYLQKNKEKVKQQKIKREGKNSILQDTYCWSFLKLIILALIIVVLFNKEPWSSQYTFGVIMVFLGYITELLFFFLVVKQYEFVGDQKILSDITNY